MTLSVSEQKLVDRWQRDFPLVERPFAVAGQPVGLDEPATIATFERLLGSGVISRIGAVVRPHTVGASTLAAMRVPPHDLERVAAIVSNSPFVNHNYEREHEINLWFVVTGPNPGTIAETLERLAAQTGLPVIDLPLLQAYHLDLGFALQPESERPRAASASSLGDYSPDLRDRGLLAAIENGLPLVERPYREVGQSLGMEEREIIGRLENLTSSGIVTRFGCVVRHRFFGYTANAMTVWDVPDEITDVVASRFISNRHVTLCYRRPRRLPDWPYNLFCMVHAKTRADALAVIDDLNAIAGTSGFAQTVLFSTRCFKQRGAVFSAPRGMH